MLAGFGWVKEGELAGMAFPGAEAWALLAREGVRAVLSLTEVEPPGDPAAAGLDILRVPIPDFGVPSDADLRRALRWIRAHVEAGRPVVVHCRGGRGRTGTLLAAHLVADGLTADEAIERVRALRPGSIETPAQERLVRKLDRRRHRRQKRR